ncbi:MAG: hypothetical protein ETSY1_33580 [Candidatus Entotheonella factor]|uniref:Glycosyltransferase subfamily 4-like N-terminal domain-containing protein n=1 Tax=Entotheonella factor TaxID=1429438 RepID=W4LAK0_ENTF1|nr:MAG: hypothetical protein ETSY1_33580 [Candidatus Entotheonella factor]
MFFRAITHYINKNDYAVMLGSLAPAGTLQAAMEELGTPSFNLNASRTTQYPLAVIRLVRLLRRHRVALLHAHGFYPVCIGLMAARLARVPFVFTRHHSDHNIRLGKRWHVMIDSWCARLADRVMAVSEATRQIMMETEHVPPKQIAVVYNGVEPVADPDALAVERLRRNLDIGDIPICLMIGRLHEEKGHHFLFKALPEVLSRVGPVAVLLAGVGPHRHALEAEVRDRCLEQVVRFLGWRDDINELIGLSSVVVLPSLAESFGQVLTEAMSLGKPVVASTTGGIPEVVADGETGLLVPQGTSRELADAICQVLQNPDYARQLGQAGRKRSALFSYQRMVQGYEAVYRVVLA